MFYIYKSALLAVSFDSLQRQHTISSLILNFLQKEKSIQHSRGWLIFNSFWGLVKVWDLWTKVNNHFHEMLPKTTAELWWRGWTLTGMPSAIVTPKNCGRCVVHSQLSIGNARFIRTLHQVSSFTSTLNACGMPLSCLAGDIGSN